MRFDDIFVVSGLIKLPISNLPAVIASCLQFCILETHCSLRGSIQKQRNCLGREPPSNQSLHENEGLMNKCDRFTRIFSAIGSIEFTWLLYYWWLLLMIIGCYTSSLLCFQVDSYFKVEDMCNRIRCFYLPRLADLCTPCRWFLSIQSWHLQCRGNPITRWIDSVPTRNACRWAWLHFKTDSECFFQGSLLGELLDAFSTYCSKAVRATKTALSEFAP